MGFAECDVQLGRAVTIEQAKQSTCGAAEMPPVQGDLFEEWLGARARGHQSVSAAVFAGATLLVGKSVEMASVLDLPAVLPRAVVRGDFAIAVEDAHAPVGSHEQQGLSDEGVRNRIVVLVEAQVRRLAGAQGLDGVAVERMRREWQKAGPLVGQSSGNRAFLRIVGHEPGVRDALRPVVELGVEVLDRTERASGEEGVA